MNNQYSMFDAAAHAQEVPRTLDTSPDGDRAGEPKGFSMIDRVRVKAGEDPIETYRVRLSRFFQKDAVYHGGRLWFMLGRKWTFCEAREPEDEALRKAGYFNIMRAVF